MITPTDLIQPLNELLSNPDQRTWVYCTLGVVVTAFVFIIGFCNKTIGMIFNLVILTILFIYLIQEIVLQ